MNRRRLALALLLTLCLLAMPALAVEQLYSADMLTEGDRYVLGLTDRASGQIARFDSALFQGHQPSLHWEGMDTLVVSYTGQADIKPEIPEMVFRYIFQNGAWQVKEFSLFYRQHKVYAEFRQDEVSLFVWQVSEAFRGGWDGWLVNLPWVGAQEAMPLAALDADKLARTMMDWRDAHLLKVVVKPFEDIFERLKLRAAPSTKAQVLGQYFSGVAPSDYVPYDANWVEVFFPGRDGAEAGERGFMMREHLAFDALVSASGRYPGLGHHQGRVLYEVGQTVLYEKQDALSKQLETLPAGTYMMVLATVGEDWLYVALQPGMDGIERFSTAAPRFGYVSSRDVGMVDNFSTAYVETTSPKDRLHLRAEPDKDAKSLGMYYYDTVLNVLFDDHVIHDGFERVRIGSQVGYMMDRFLSYRSAGTGDYLPPLSTVSKEAGLVDAPRKDAKVLQTLEKGRRLMVLGTVGNYYQVKLSPEWDGLTGFVHRNYLGQPGTPPATSIQLKKGAVVYEKSDQGYKPSEWSSDVQLSQPIRGRVYDHISVDAEYWYADFEMVDGGILSSHYFRVNDAKFDPGLIW